MSKKIYNIGEVCNFRELTSLVKKEKINAVVANLFVMKKETTYRDFQKYIDGLEDIIDKLMTEEPFNNFYFVLFIDDSVINNTPIYEEVKRILNKNKRSIIFHYDCPILKHTEKDKKGLHLDLLGFFIRYFPYFDFPNNPFNFCLCIDVDNMIKRIDKFKIITKIAFDNKADFCYKAYDSELIINREYNHSPRAKNVINQRIPFIISGHSNCGGFRKVPLNVLTDFLIDVRKNPSKYNKFCDIRSGINFKYFCYGLDEYFLNNILIEAYNNNNMKVIPYIPYNFFASIGINNKIVQDMLKITYKDLYKFRFLNQLKNKDNYNEYIRIYKKVDNLLRQRDYSIIKKCDLLSMKPYPNYICKKYYKIYIGGKFIKDVDLFYLKINNNEIEIFDNLKDYNLINNDD